MTVPTPMYIRHRDRMIQESVFEDLQNTFIALRWMTGTTTHPVYDPSTPLTERPAKVTITTDEDDLLQLLEGYPVNLIDYFPESENRADAGGNGANGGRTPMNTFALDNGSPDDATQLELGSATLEQPYVFNMAFYAISDAVALAVLNDLRDRYQGRVVDGDGINLYNYLGDTSMPVARLDVDSFRSARDAERVAPSEVHLFFAELRLTDYVE